MDERLRLIVEMQNKASAELRKLSKDFDGVKPTAGMKNTASWFQTLEGASANANKALRPLAGGLGTIGVSGLAAGLSVAGLIGQFRDLAKAMPALQELSRQTGISRTELERLKATAANLNIDPSKMTAAIGVFSGEMVQFSKQSGEVYAEMQNGASGLARKIAGEWKEHPEQALKDYLGWLAEIPAAAQRAGKSAQEGVQIQRYWAQKGLGDADMAQVVGKGMGGFQEAYSQAARDVHEITDETVAAAEKFDRSIASFERTWKDFETTVGPTVFDGLRHATDDFREVFDTIKSTMTWFDKVKDHPIQAAAEAATNAIDAQAAHNKAHPEGIILDLPGLLSKGVHAVTGAPEAPAPRPSTLLAPAPVPTALQPGILSKSLSFFTSRGPTTRRPSAAAAEFHPDDDRLSRARASDLPDRSLDGFVTGALDKPVTHLVGTLKTAAAVIDGNLRPAAFHPAGGAGLTAALDPEATIAAGTRRGFIEAFREIQGTQDLDGKGAGGGGGFTPASFGGSGVPGGRSASAAGDRPGTPNMRYGHGGRTPGSDAYPGQGGTDDTGGAGATSGMRARNLGNIGYFGQKSPGLIGPSNSRDIDHSIALYATQEDGIRAAARLALHKYQSGMHTTAALIAGKGGWTPGALGPGASVNVAKSMDLSNQDDLHLDDPGQMRKFLHGLAIQEHGKAGAYYTPEMIDRALSGKGATTATGPSARENSGVSASAAGRAVDALDGLDGAGSAQVGKSLGAFQHIGQWCADAVNASLKTAGIKGSGSSMALSFRNWGQRVGFGDAQRGDVIVENHGGGRGHVGFATGGVRRDAAGNVVALGMTSGNHGNRVHANYWESVREIEQLRRASEAFRDSVQPVEKATAHLRAAPPIAPMPTIAPEPPRNNVAGGQQARMDPLHIHMTHTESGRTRVAVKHGEGVKVSLRTAPTMVQTA